MDNNLNYKQFNNYLLYEDGTVISLLINKLIRKRIGLKHPAKGKNTKNGRFSDSDIKNIRGLSKQGKSQRQIAALYQVSKSAIQQILEGKTYSWVK